MSDRYHTYRIPAIVNTTKGSLLAFCEGRKHGQGDAGDIDLLIKRSTDHGETWSKQAVVWSEKGITCGNPSPVVDEQTGTIWLLATWNSGDDIESKIIAGQSKDTRQVPLLIRTMEHSRRRRSVRTDCSKYRRIRQETQAV